MRNPTTKGERAFIRYGKQLGRVIGAHARLIGNPRITNDEYLRAQADSDEAAATVKYLAMHLDNRHLAVLLCSAAGCPGYINYR